MTVKTPTETDATAPAKDDNTIAVAFKIDRDDWNKVIDAAFAMNRSRTNAQAAKTVVMDFISRL